jgi:outer membrane lipoprotein-sorting protein
MERMIRKMKRLFAAITISALFLGTAPLANALDGAKILQQVDRNLNPESYEMYRKLINIEPDGSKKEFVLYTIKKGQDRMVALFLSPASEKGRSTLRLEDNMWLYMPNVGRPIRITSLQSIVGGVFNNSDILRLDYTTEYTVESAEEGDGQYLLKLKARSGTVAYDQIEMAVDKKTVIPTEIKCFASTGILIKTLHYSETKDFGGGLARPSILETDSPLQKGYRSVMVFAEIKAREFSDEVFTLNFLPKVDELR